MQPLAAYGGMQATLFEGDEPTRVTGLGATPELFEALRVQPAMGRLINADDLAQGRAAGRDDQPRAVAERGSDRIRTSSAAAFSSARRGAP